MSEQPTPSLADTITTARETNHLARCSNCRNQSAQTTAMTAANGASIGRRDRLSLGLHHARQLAVTG